MLDPKKKGYAISANQMADGKFVACWDPAGDGNRLQDRIDPLPTVILDNPNLVSHIKVLWENLISSSWGNNARYFEGLARVYGEALFLALCELVGKRNLPALYDVISMLPGGGERWLDFAFHISKSRFGQVVEAEVAIYVARTRTSRPCPQ